MCAAADHVQIVTKGSPLIKMIKIARIINLSFSLIVRFLPPPRQSRREKHIAPPATAISRLLFSCTAAAALIFLPFEDLFIYLCTLESDALSNFFNPLCDLTLLIIKDVPHEGSRTSLFALKM